MDTPARDTTPWPSADTLSPGKPLRYSSPRKSLRFGMMEPGEVSFSLAEQALSLTRHRIPQSFTKNRGWGRHVEYALAAVEPS